MWLPIVISGRTRQISSDKLHASTSGAGDQLGHSVAPELTSLMIDGLESSGAKNKHDDCYLKKEKLKTNKGKRRKEMKKEKRKNEGKKERKKERKKKEKGKKEKKERRKEKKNKTRKQERRKNNERKKIKRKKES